MQPRFDRADLGVTARAISSKVISSYSARITASRWSGGSSPTARDTISAVSLRSGSSGPATKASSSSGSQRLSVRHRFRIKLRATPTRNARSGPRPASNRSGARSRARKQSCVTSSAALADPVIRQANRYTASLCSRKIDLKSASVTCRILLHTYRGRAKKIRVTGKTAGPTSELIRDRRLV